MAFASFISSSVRNRCCTARLSHGFSEEPISQICCHEQAINSKPSGLGHFDCANCTSEPNFAKIFTVWRRLHIPNSIQAFIVCALSAAMLATGFAIRAVLHERTGVFRDLWWPHQFDPLVIRCSVLSGTSCSPRVLASRQVGCSRNAGVFIRDVLRYGLLCGVPFLWWEMVWCRWVFRCSGPILCVSVHIARHGHRFPQN